MVEVIIRPDADDTDGNWTAQDNSTSLFVAIDETSSSAADYIKSGPNPSNDTSKIRFGNFGATVGEPFIVDYDYGRIGSAELNLTVRLLQGSTEIAKWDHAGVTGTLASPATAQQTLTAPQFAAISDFDNLFLDFKASIQLWLLDNIANLGPVYSYRKLLSSYAGNCVRIRRSSDNSEQDFGFVSNVVDTAGIATFVGGGSGFIVTWYDQNGNAVDITNSTAASQPLFVASGINSLPTTRFVSADKLSKAITLTDIAASNQFTALIVQMQAGAKAQNTTINALASLQITIHATYDDVIYFDFGGTGGSGRVNVSQPTGWDDNPHVVEVFRETGGTQAIVVDGASLVSASRSDTPSGTDTLIIGAHGTGIEYEGDISEIVFIKADTGSSNRNTIRRDGAGSGVAQSMGSYYGITVS
jgi:hypothetical protein